MILEGIMTTFGEDGTVNIAPMGPIVDAAMTRLELRPYQTSTTYKNLKRTGQGVFHVTDDVELLAHAAVGKVEPVPKMIAADAVKGWILADCCRWYAFKVAELDDSRPRTQIIANVVDRGHRRDFFGLNRAKHAVVEAAILATRVQLLPIEQIMEDFSRLRPLIEKTGGEAERRAFEFLEHYVQAASPLAPQDFTS
jgi:hypothetical protein